MGNFLNYIPRFPDFLEDRNLTLSMSHLNTSYWVAIKIKR